MSGSHVGYSKVEEIIVGSGKTIKTEYNYLNEEEKFCGVLKEFGSAVPSIPNLSNGLLSSKVEYNNSAIARSITYNYHTIRTANNYGTKVFFKSLPQGHCNECVMEPKQEDIILVFINQFSNWNKLLSETEVVDGVSTTKNYFYDNPQFFQSTRTITNFSNSSIEVKNKYPLDFTTIPAPSALNTMRNNNMINYPIEIQTWRDGKLIDATFNKYEDVVAPRIYELYKLETDQPLTNFSGLDEYGNLSNTIHYKLKTNFNSFNTYGNPQSVTTSDGITTSMLWDSNQTYLMANVEGVPYSVISSLDGKNCSYDSETLRGQLKALAPQTIITTYSYKPLYGVTSITDNTGLTTKYEYDTFGRLQTVLVAGKIVNHYEYHYAGQGSSSPTE